MKTYIENKTFERIDFTVNRLEIAEYEKCNFINCNFSNTNLSQIYFSECCFTGCNMSVAILSKTSLRNIKFKDCKLLGLHFHNCNEFLFSVAFENCILNLSSFFKLKLKKTKFINCSLHEVDFTQADLSESLFDNCDFSNAIFDDTRLEKADLRTSYNYSLDPELNYIKKAKFSTHGISGLLHKYDIVIE
ncbi:MAG: pentapeptide repeat-containing protein [Bacteroidia bacterium]